MTIGVLIKVYGMGNWARRDRSHAHTGPCKHPCTSLFQPVLFVHFSHTCMDVHTQPAVVASEFILSSHACLLDSPDLQSLTPRVVLKPVHCR